MSAFKTSALSAGLPLFYCSVCPASAQSLPNAPAPTGQVAPNPYGRSKTQNRGGEQ